LKIISVFGTRPEMIKLWSTLKKLDEFKFEHIMVHTGQNFTPELKDFFFRDLKLRKPDYELCIDTSTYAREVAQIIEQSDILFEKVKPDGLLILGDTYSGLSVMPAANRGIKSFHMEAGLRAWDSRMPEQRNRILIDHMSTYNLPFNKVHRENLLRENIHPSKIFCTGNPTFEVMKAFENEICSSDILERLRLPKKSYILVTAHRSENVDKPEQLDSIFSALEKVSANLDLELVFPMHPRTQQKISKTGIKPSSRIRMMNPLGFYDFNYLFKNALCVLSDSGTAPEESYFYKVPCVSLRQSTERPETIEGGAHIVAGLCPQNILEAVTMAVRLPWVGRYELEEDFSPSTVVLNVMSSHINNYF
jgi:UDP-N-acetylglucosamine 2-epimerase (non-hydrolysing)